VHHLANVESIDNLDSDDTLHEGNETQLTRKVLATAAPIESMPERSDPHQRMIARERVRRAVNIAFKAATNEEQFNIKLLLQHYGLSITSVDKADGDVQYVINTQAPKQIAAIARELPIPIEEIKERIGLAGLLLKEHIPHIKGNTNQLDYEHALNAFLERGGDPLSKSAIAYCKVAGLAIINGRVAAVDDIDKVRHVAEELNRSEKSIRQAMAIVEDRIPSRANQSIQPLQWIEQEELKKNIEAQLTGTPIFSEQQLQVLCAVGNMEIHDDKVITKGLPRFLKDVLPDLKMTSANAQASLDRAKAKLGLGAKKQVQVELPSLLKLF
jgi:hypothetical protein